MMIKLTKLEFCGVYDDLHNVGTIFINPNKIKTMETKNDCGNIYTVIYIDNKKSINVQESPEEILEKIVKA